MLQLLNPVYLSVELTFQRRFLYHITTTYVPTSFLLIITVLCVFFGEYHFETMIMVALTAMLVMYTLYLDISESLPPTAYQKMIDIWLLYCLFVPFLVFISLAIVELLKTKRNDGHNETENKDTSELITTFNETKIKDENRNKSNNDQIRKRISMATLGGQK